MTTKNPLGKLSQRSVKTLGAPAPDVKVGIPGEDLVHGRRRRGSGEVVSQTVRLRREDWQRMGELRIKEGLSSQEQFIMALGLLFAQYGLEPPIAP